MAKNPMNVDFLKKIKKKNEIPGNTRRARFTYIIKIRRSV